MASERMIKAARVLSLACLGFLVFNVVFSFLCISRMDDYKRKFEITKQDFASNLHDAVGLFLSNYVDEVANSDYSSSSYSVEQKFLEDMYTYYKYKSGVWVANVSGCDFVAGDYFGGLLVTFVTDNRLYVQDAIGNVTIFRPRRTAGSVPARGGAPAAGDVSNDGAL